MFLSEEETKIKLDELEKLSETVVFKEGVHFKLDPEHSEYKKKVLIHEFKDEVKYGFASKDKNKQRFMGNCNKCGAKVFYMWDTELNEISCVPRDESLADKCEGDYDTIEFEVEMPTGNLVFFDWLHVMTPMSDNMEKGPSINYDLGIKVQIENYAKRNIFHTFVGNTSPNIYKKGDTLTVGGYLHEEDEWPETYDADQEYLGYVCTDLWWATLVDEAVLIENLKPYHTAKEVREALSSEYKAKIRPGVYKCTYLGYGDYVDTYATLEWVREID